MTIVLTWTKNLWWEILPQKLINLHFLFTFQKASIWTRWPLLLQSLVSWPWQCWLWSWLWLWYTSVTILPKMLLGLCTRGPPVKIINSSSERARAGDVAHCSNVMLFHRFLYVRYVNNLSFCYRSCQASYNSAYNLEDSQKNLTLLSKQYNFCYFF